MVDYLCGQVPEERLFTKDLNFFKQNRIELLLSTEVTKIIYGPKPSNFAKASMDTRRRLILEKNCVELFDGKTISYDKLLIATE